MLLLSLSLGCLNGGPFGPSPSFQTLYLNSTVSPPSVDAGDERHLSEFTVPYEWYASEVSSDIERRCRAGEAVIEYYPRTIAMMEIGSEAIKVSDSQVSWLDSGKVPEYEQNAGRITALYDSLVSLRVRMQSVSGTCFPVFEGQLLVMLPEQVPLPLLWQALETADEAGFTQLYLVVDDPVARGRAVASPPRETGVGQPSPLQVRPAVLSPGQLVRAREQLADNRRVWLQGQGSCMDHPVVSWEKGGGLLLRPNESAEQEPLAVSAVPARFESMNADGVWLRGAGDSTGMDLLSALSALSAQSLPPHLAPLETAGVDFLRPDSIAGWIPETPYWSVPEIYTSMEEDTWVPVVQISFSETPSDYPCMDSSGQLQLE